MGNEIKPFSNIGEENVKTLIQQFHKTGNLGLFWQGLNEIVLQEVEIDKQLDEEV